LREGLAQGGQQEEQVYEETGQGLTAVASASNFANANGNGNANANGALNANANGGIRPASQRARRISVGS
jgi:hypothetical protein